MSENKRDYEVAGGKPQVQARPPQGGGRSLGGGNRYSWPSAVIQELLGVWLNRVKPDLR